MTDRNIIYVNRARCKKCGDVIESRSVHDFRQCKCGAIFTDGGKDYIRRGAKDLNDIEDLSLATYDIKIGSDPTQFWDKFKPAFTWNSSITLKKGKNDCQPFYDGAGNPFLKVKIISYDRETLPTVDELKEIIKDYVRWNDIFKKKGMSIVNELLKDKYQRILPTRKYPVKIYIYGGDDCSYTHTVESADMARLVLQEACEIASKGEDLWEFLIDNMVQTN